MKNILIILLTFLSYFANGQLWDAVKIGDRDCDSIMKGNATIWRKPPTPIEHDTAIYAYNFEMTAGKYQWDIDKWVVGYDLYMGSIDPNYEYVQTVLWSPQPYSLSYPGSVPFFSIMNMNVVDSIFIGSTKYSGSNITSWGNGAYTLPEMDSPFSEYNTFNIRIYGKMEY